MSLRIFNTQSRKKELIHTSAKQQNPFWENGKVDAQCDPKAYEQPSKPYVQTQK